MKLGLPLAFLVIAALNPSAQAADLIFGGHEFKPFTFEDGPKLGGLVANVIEEACGRARISCKTEYYPNRRVKRMVKAKMIDVGTPYGWNPERDVEYLFSPPMVDTAYGFFVNTTSDFKPNKIEDFAGKAIGVSGPSNTQTSLEKLSKLLVEEKSLKPFSLKVIPNFDGTNLFQLSKNRLEAVYVNLDLGNTVIAERKIQDVKYAVNHRQLRYYACIKKDHDPQKIAAHEKFSTAVKEMTVDGTLDEIAAKWGLPPMDLKSDFK